MTIAWQLIMMIDFLVISLLTILGFNVQDPQMTRGISTKISGLIMDELWRAYTSRWSEMEWDTNEVKEQPERSIVMSKSKKKHKWGHENGRRISIGEQSPQYDGNDALDYHRVTYYAGDVILPHITFIGREWNKYNETKDGMCNKMMNKTSIYVDEMKLGEHHCGNGLS